MKDETALKSFNLFTVVLIYDAASSSDSIVAFLRFSVHNPKNGAFGTWLCMVLELGRFARQNKNTWKVTKCGAGEGWIRSFGPTI